MLSVPLSTSDLHCSRCKSGGICKVLSTGAFTLFCHDFHGFNEGLLSFLSCPRVCLLDVSRLLGLTLRPSAPVCCCHRDSLTRGKLAVVQDAVCVLFFSVFSFGSARDDLFPVISDSLREKFLQALQEYEGPAVT